MEIFLIVLAIFSVIPLVLSWKLAKKKNRNHRGWIVLTIFLGWVATLILACLTKLPERKVEY